ncbi:MAG TPA: hypothetical protein VK879_03335 [Candidatus Sulfomarinibacteraceae bacterium]|nr:hypothetical protein [Candidatus Sulfomarinibacteraceae bacterium]
MNETTNQADDAYRQAVEQLLGDESLRDALTDDQAQRLLDWALSRLEREAQQAAELPAETARATLEARLDQVRQVMKHANRLVEELPDAAQGRMRESMLHFVEALCEVDSRAVQVNDVMALEELASEREALDSGTIFERLMAIVRQEDEEE